MKNSLKVISMVGAAVVAGLLLAIYWVSAKPASKVPSVAAVQPEQIAERAVAAAQPALPESRKQAADFSAAEAKVPPPAKAALLPASPREKLLAGAVTLAIRETPVDERGTILRTRLVRVENFKYPLLRVEETVRRDPASGQEVIVSSQESVGDHVLVKVRAGAEKALAGVVAQAGGHVLQKMYGGRGLYLVAFAPADMDTVPNGVAALGTAALVIKYAEPDYVVYAVSNIPNDTDFGKLWGMNNTGQVVGSVTGVVGADIHAPLAWDMCTGSSNTIVAVIDTGIDYTHPDLADNMWKNPGETGLDAEGHDKAANGLDDDGNGYIDDVYGVDQYNSDCDPMDDNGHGTHCAGTIGGVGNNGLGVAGVSWGVKLMALKFLGGNGSGLTAGAAEQVFYAIDKGAKLTANSWAGGAPIQALRDAIAEACASNQLFVAAAGNDGTDNDTTPSYPSSYTNDNVIAVAATDNTDKLASFSNYGRTTVDLSAPGVAIWSCKPGNSYQSLSGTSMATPHVAGACALVWSWNSDATATDVKQAILDCTDRIAALSNKCVSGGRLNIYNTLLRLEKYMTIKPVTGFSLIGPEGGPFVPSSLTYTVKNIGTNSFSWTASKTVAWLDLSLTAGTLAPDESNAVVVSVNATANTLSIGTYTDTITFTNNVGTTAYYRPVTLTVADVLSVSPATGLTSIGVEGGPFTPPLQVYVVSNSASSARTWSGSVDTNWIELSSTGSTLGAHEAANVTLSINANASTLPLGTCFATATFSNTASGVSQPRPVTLQMVEALSVSPGTDFVSIGSPGGPFAPSDQTFVLSNQSALAHGWTASKTASWLTLSAASGTLSSGATADVTVSINSGANAVLAGRYTDTVTFSNTVSHSTQTRQVALCIDADDFTETFCNYTHHTNDLRFMTLTFTPPDGSGNFYSVCRQPATSFPTDPTGGTKLTLDDDSFVAVTLTGGAQVKLYGTNYDTFYVGSNGYITFGEGDITWWPYPKYHFDRPRISVLFEDFSPQVHGAVTWKQLADRAVVTYQGVRQYLANIDNNFQVEMFFDGRIRMTWLSLGDTRMFKALNGLVGLSRGGGTPVGFVESDLTGYPLWTGCAVIPVITGAPLTTESCTPTNGAIDPGETVTVNFSVKNAGTISTTNLVATLLTAGGVTAQNGPQTYGALIPGGGSVSRPFSFTSSGVCGGPINVVLQFQDGTLNYGAVTSTFVLGPPRTTVWTQNFDAVTAPALPAGWTTAASGCQPLWVVAATNAADSVPNCLFTSVGTTVGVNEVVSPPIFIDTPSAQLTFRHWYNLYQTLSYVSDAGVLEIKIGNGSWLGILVAGGSFVTGGYNGTVYWGWDNPLHGADCWSGDSGGWITTIVNLPASAAGQNILLRWRCGTDKYDNPNVGWYIDTMSIAESHSPVIPPSASLSITASVPNAAESGPVSGLFTVTRTGSAADNLSVYFAVGGTASNGVDYVPALPSLIVMAAGDSSTNITITPVDDSIVEGSETVKLTILPDVVYAIGTPSNATVTIADNVKTLTINSAHGSPVPGGIITNGSGAVLTNYVNSPVTQETNEYVCTGWTMTGNEPQSGTTNSFSMTLTNNATLTWQWTTNIVEGLPSVAFGPTNLFFAYNLPHSPASQNFTVTNIGQNRLHISNSWNAAWLTVSPAQTNGITNGQSAVFAVSINTGNLTIGTSNAVITISSTNADNTPVTIPVQLTVQIAPVVTNRLLFDFGVSTNRTMLPGWNNVTNNALAVLITNAVNSTGALSGVSLRITQLFTKGYTPINGGVVASNLYPASAQSDYFAVGDVGDPSATVRLEGLDTNQTYTLTVFGSRTLSGTRTGRYSVGTNSVTLDALNNSNRVAVLSNIAPNASGQIDLVVSNVVRGSGYAYLGVLDVTGVTPYYYMLTVNSMLGGSVNPTGGIYLAGSVQISASASNYYHFVQWSGGLSDTSNPVNVTMNTNLTIQAEFTENLLTNNVPAWWLAQYNLATNDAAAIDDPDGDGLKTWQEYIAGTDPTNNASVFKVTDQELQSAGRVITWNATNGRLYSVYFTTNLLTPDLWPLIYETTSGAFTDTIYGAADKGFYRIKVRLAP